MIGNAVVMVEADNFWERDLEVDGLDKSSVVVRRLAPGEEIEGGIGLRTDHLSGILIEHD